MMGQVVQVRTCSRSAGKAVWRLHLSQMVSWGLVRRSLPMLSFGVLASSPDGERILRALTSVLRLELGGPIGSLCGLLG